jgi:hypothetical protein
VISQSASGLAVALPFGKAIGIRGGAVFHIKSISSGVSL